MNAKNLNAAYPETDRNYPYPELPGSVSSSDGNTRIVLRNLEQELLSCISNAQLVVGCVAWLTSTPIIQALSKVPRGVSIVVQKEDFLRPDIAPITSWKTHLSRLYGSIPCLAEKFMFEGNTAATLSTSCEPTLDPIRCCGNYNRDKNPAFPRMHHKFLVFCDVDEIDYSKEGTPKPVHPTKVWTGSFNLTKNAGMSLENAVILTDPALINAYYQEWGWVLSLSEPLNWETDWLTPEFRIGT